MKRERLEKIIAQELPGHRLSSSEMADSSTTHVKPEASTPELDDILEQIEGGGAPADASPKTAAKKVSGESLDDSIELVERADPADPLNRANRPKAKVISPEGKIIGSQG